MSQLPKRIRVSGLPLLQLGWNSVYVKTDADYPEYVMRPYALCGILPIEPVRIFRGTPSNKWHLDLAGLGSIHGPIYSNDESTPTPVGKWIQLGSHVLTVTNADRDTGTAVWPIVLALALIFLALVFRG